MKTICCALLFGCSASLFGLQSVVAADADEASLQGKWTVESFSFNGAPVEMMKEATRDLKEGKYTLAPKTGDTIEGTYKLDSSGKPKLIDLVVNGRVLKGIYDLAGDTLKICYPLNDSERPSEFVSKPDTGIILVVHKRAK